ncbi:hypothetical protein EPN42_05595 [bacterium]|nr:MAG: hypothetical protein EPN42_05595 [bacterium]
MGRPRLFTSAKLSRLHRDFDSQGPSTTAGTGRSTFTDDSFHAVHGLLRPGRPVLSADGQKYVVGGSVAHREQQDRDLRISQDERGARAVRNAGAHNPDRARGPQPGDPHYCEECGGAHDPNAGWLGTFISSQQRQAHGSHGSSSRRTRQKPASAADRLSMHAALGQYADT